MYYNGIVDRRVDMDGRIRVRVDLGDRNTTFFWFNHDPHEAEVMAETENYIAKCHQVVRPIKSLKLMRAENAFVDYCRSIGLPDKADSDAFDALCAQLKAEGKFLEAVEIGLRSLALINNITQNGGIWADITYHDLSQYEPA